jgi:hypothetical protein
MAAGTNQTKSISERLLAATLELQEWEKLVVSGDMCSVISAAPWTIFGAPPGPFSSESDCKS